MNIQLYLDDYTRLWHQASKDFNPVNGVISLEEKLKREDGLIRFSKALQQETDRGKNIEANREKLMLQFKEQFGHFFKNSLNFNQQEYNIIAESGLMGITREFMAMARRFDPEVNINDVFQASRNVWIINSLQIMMGLPVKLSSSVFAYSMLYPYSDNYLDDASVSKAEKQIFSQRFRQRLSGEKVIPLNNREQIIFDLVTLIETDWDRERFPKVYDSLLAIHDAQTRSIMLMGSDSDLGDDELLSICIEKGGTSVLADGYLISGTLTERQEHFCFGFGAFLQFVDDIQDVKGDMDEQLETLFTRAAKNRQLEQLVNQSIDFGWVVMGNLEGFSGNNLESMSSLMIKSNSFLLTEAVGLNSDLYAPAYVERFEAYSPFRFEFIRKRRSNLESNRISLMKKIGAFVFDEASMAMQA
jgi:hypothetical protein